MMMVENGLWCTGAACFIRMNHLAERVHQRPLKQQQYCLTKPTKKADRQIHHFRALFKSRKSRCTAALYYIANT